MVSAIVVPNIKQISDTKAHFSDFDLSLAVKNSFVPSPRPCYVAWSLMLTPFAPFRV
jgi:hypothetical protein